MFDYRARQSDAGTTIEALIEGADGKPRDLTGCSVVIVLGLPGGTVRHPVTAINDPPTSGIVSYLFTQTDLATPGYVHFYFEVTPQGGAPMSHPNTNDAAESDLILYIAPKL